MSVSAELANALRFLSIDAVQKARSGHPGMPMGMATIAEVLWRDHLRHNPRNPQWVNRDRFVLSNGHGSMLLYSLLHLSGYDLSIEDLKQFRSLYSKTPGHPEYAHTPGVETTTGPLGQGLANAVGMALAERTLAHQFNQPEHAIIDHFTYVFVGDGCLMEGISHEVCSLAGTLGLGKLIVFWDDNGISIDGEVVGWCRDDVPGRFRSYGWDVIEDIDGHQRDQIDAAIIAAKGNLSQPTLICCKTVIGYGSPNKAGTEATHGAPLGDEEIAATRKALQWPYAPFEIPEAIYQAWDAREKGERLEKDWQNAHASYHKLHPVLSNELQRRLSQQLPQDWQTTLQAIVQKAQGAANTLATRKASQNFLNLINTHLPELLGGSADLTGSNLTNHSNSQPLSEETLGGNYVYYGVREFGMAAMMNGIALHGGFIPYGGTFLVFIDYARNALRMAALMKQRVIFVLTHDSIGLGEDGPTHQPIEHLNMCRITPNVRVWRPCDEVETFVAWQSALEHQAGPSVLALSRQNLAPQQRTTEQLAVVSRGGYVLYETSAKKAEIIFIATGSEVEITRKAAMAVEQKGHGVRIVSMPCAEVFLQQSNSYQQEVLPENVKRRIAVEAGNTSFWLRFVGLEGRVVGIDRFGESAPAEKIYETLGLTSAHIERIALELL